MDTALLHSLRADLTAADFRASAIGSLLGQADSARLRGVFVPASRVLDARGRHPLHTLVRVFLLGESVSHADLDAAFPSLRAEGALKLGLVAEVTAPKKAASEPMLRAVLSLNPVDIVDSHLDAPAEWWLISDLDDQLRRGPARPDHVMGVGGATRSLIAQAAPGAVARALDLGTGCGVVALHLALRSEHVVATDVSERALTLAAANAELNGLADRIEFRAGSLFEPVAGETFDLVLTNPPFVITPRRTDDGLHPEVPVYEYRDGGMVGDALAQAVVVAGPRHLAPGGSMLCLANWESPWGGNGLRRVAEWAGEAAVAPLTVWVVERDRVDPVTYAETWARDGGARPGTEEFDALLTAWLDDFAARRITAVGLGAIRIRREADQGARAVDTVVHVEQATGGLSEHLLGRDLEAAFIAGAAAARMSDDAVLDTRWLVASWVTEERVHQPGVESPSALTLVTDRPIARRVTADPLLAAAVGASDGDLTLRQIADALATLLDVDAAAAREAVVAGARELAWLGMLSPAEG